MTELSGRRWRDAIWVVAVEVCLVDVPVIECLSDTQVMNCVAYGSGMDLLLDAGQEDLIRKDLSLCADGCMQGVCKSREFALASYVVVLISAWPANRSEYEHENNCRSGALLRHLNFIGHSMRLRSPIESAAILVIVAGVMYV